MSRYYNSQNSFCLSPCQASKVKLTEQDLAEISTEKGYVDRLKKQRLQIEALKADFQNKDQQLAEREIKINRLSKQQEEYRGLKSEYEKLLMKSERQQLQLQRLRKQCSQKDQRLNQFYAQNCKEANLALRRQLIQLRTQKEHLLIGLQKQKESAKLRQNSLAEDLSKAKLNYGTLRIEHDGLRERQAALQSQLKQAKQCTVDQVERTQVLAAEVATLNSIVADLKQQKDDIYSMFLAQSQKSEEIYNQFRKQQSEHQRQVCGLQVELKSSEQQAKKLGQQLLELRLKDKQRQSRQVREVAQKEKLSHLSVELGSSHAQLAGRVSLLEQQIGRKDKLIAELRGKVAQFQKTLSQGASSREQQRRVNSELSRLRGELSSSCRFEVDKIDKLIESIHNRKRK